MNLSDRYLEWRKLRARKRRDYKAYFRLVDHIAKREAQKLVMEKIKK